MAYMDELRVGDQVQIVTELEGKLMGEALVIRLRPDETGGPDSRVIVCFRDDLELSIPPHRIRLIGTEDDGA